MRVYRCITLQEVINKYTNQKNEKFDNPSLNTYNYQEGIEYVHFFRYYEFAKYYFDLNKKGSYERENDHYLLFMTANIPEEILERGKSFGFYHLGYEEIPMPEYAIPIQEFSSEYIVDITDHPMGFYERKREKEEYKRYIELIRNLKSSAMEMEQITSLLLHGDFETLLGMKIDMMSEEEGEKEEKNLISTIFVPDSNDIPIKEFNKK